MPGLELLAITAAICSSVSLPIVLLPFYHTLCHLYHLHFSHLIILALVGSAGWIKWMTEKIVYRCLFPHQSVVFLVEI